MKLKERLALALLGAMLAVSSANAQTDAYPNKLIRFVVGYPAGGLADVFARLFAKELSSEFGQPVIVENKSGASGVIGAMAVSTAPADGYTLYYVVASHTILPALNKQLPYDTVKSFAAVTQLVTSPNIFVVPAKSPYKTLKEFIDAAKQSPGKLTYSTPGYGTTTHLTIAMLEQAASIELLHIPYKSSAESNQAGIVAEVDAVSGGMFSAGNNVREGKMRPLAVVGDTRSPSFPDVPTYKELGYSILGDTWMGILAPAGTPKPIIDKLQAAFKRILSKHDFRDRLLSSGQEPLGSTAEEFQKRIEFEVSTFKELGAKIGLKTE